MPTLLLLGADSDIGQSCARQFARAGFDLLLTSRRRDHQLPAWVAELQRKNPITVQVLYFEAGTPAAAQKLYQALPTLPEVVISAIGYLGDAAVARQQPTESKAIITSNYLGLVYIFDLLAPAMQARGFGHLIGISSVAGERGRASNYHYGSAKAGFTAYLSGLRQFLRPRGVQVSTIIPGFVRTKMLGDQATPSVLTASPEQIASATWRAYQRQRSVVYALPIWRFIMWGIRHLPEPIFQRLRL